MNCEKFCSNARQYLDDLLPPALRREISAHYAECPKCRAYTLALGTFASDFRRMANICLPVSLQEKILAEMNPAKKAAPLEQPESRGQSWKILLISFMAAVALLGAGKLFFMPSYEKRSDAPLETGKGPLALRGLPEPGEGHATAPAVLKSSKHAINLRPIHWHLHFQTPEEKRAFAEMLKTRAVSAEFDSDSFLSLVFSRAGAEKILPQLVNAAEDPQEVPLKPEELPEFDGKISMSFLMDAPKSQAGAFVQRHWHFRFQFPNRYPFLESLKKKQFHFLYESPDVWVFEVPGREMDAVYSLVNNTHALIAEFGEETLDSAEELEGVLVRISIYIAEG